MNRLELAIRVLLMFCGFMVLIGGVWFLGDTGTYLAVIFGGSTLFWVIAWDRTRLLPATGMAALISELTSGLTFLKSFNASELDVNMMQLAVFFVSTAACYIWVRRKIL